MRSFRERGGGEWEELLRGTRTRLAMLQAIGGPAELHAAASPRGRGGVNDRRRREIRLAYLLLAPAVLLVFGVMAYPLGWQIWTSLTDWSPAAPVPHFVGLANYVALAHDADYWRAIGITL